MSERIWWGWKYVIWLVVAIAILALIVLPIVTTFLVRNSNLASSDGVKILQQVENFMSQGMLWFAAVWIVFLGGTFASFLNVVSWRVPRGKSILGSSRCPACNTPLTFKDNMPFWGWLKNWGHCSTCDASFSVRYFLAELVLGLIFLTVVGTYLLSGGATLPFRERNPAMLLNRMLLEPDTDLLLIAVLHLVALTVLFTFALIELGRFAIPNSVFIVGLVILGLIAVWPGAILVPWLFPFYVPSETSMFAGWVAVVLGAASGFLFGSWFDLRDTNRKIARSVNKHESELSGLIAPQSVRESQAESQLRFGLTAVGGFAGWQSVFVVGAIWMLLRLLLYRESHEVEHVKRPRLISTHSLLLVATLLHLSTWKWFDFFA